MEDLFVTEQHPVSKRWAILEDDGLVAWLYLTEPDGTKPVADCWLYNRVPAPVEFDFQRGETPIATLPYLISSDPFAPPAAEAICFRWSPDGHSIAVLFEQDIFGFIANASQPGYSKLLSKVGPFGAPINQTVYSNVFEET